MATATDTFNRADNTDVGAAWDVVPSENALQIVTNRIRVQSANGCESYNATIPGADQFAKVAVPTFSNAGSAGIITRASNAAQTFYWHRFLHGTGSEIAKLVAGVGTSLVSNATNITAGASIFGSAVGTRLCLWDGTALVATITDSAIASGRGGMHIIATNPGDVELANFYVGDISTATVRPSGDGTTTGWTKTGGSGTYASCVVDDPDSNDGDTSYVLSPNVADGQMWVLLDDMPSDFYLGLQATLKASAKKINTPVMAVDTSDMYLLLQRSDEATNLTVESAVCNVTVTASYTLFSRDVTINGTNGKTEWDGARLRLRFDHITASTIDTTNQIRITAAEVLIPYIPTEPAAAVTSFLFPHQPAAMMPMLAM